MADDGIAAQEIARQIAVLRPRVQGSRGVMGYLDKPQEDKRADVNKMFLASTIRGVNSHNRRQEEDKCWTLRRMERKLDESRDRRSCSRERRRSRRRRSRSRSPIRSRRRRSRSRSREKRRSSRRSRSPVDEKQNEKKEDEDERSYWAKKKAEKTHKLWENLHSEGSVSVENAPAFSSEESDDDDVKPAKPKKEKKHKKHKKKSEKKSKRRSRS